MKDSPASRDGCLCSLFFLKYHPISSAATEKDDIAKIKAAQAAKIFFCVLFILPLRDRHGNIVAVCKNKNRVNFLKTKTKPF